MKIGIVIGRIGGIDGVALETEKWIHVLKRMGHKVFTLTGLVERKMNEENISVLPELNFYHPLIIREQKNAFFVQGVTENVLFDQIESVTNTIKNGILTWIVKNSLDLLITENSTALPCHLSMGIALGKILEETGIKCIAHDHDFSWERENRYDTKFSYIKEIKKHYFPINLPNVNHAVINTQAKNDLKRAGIESVVVPNVMDFERQFGEKNEYNSSLLKQLGFRNDDILLFQITRIVRRKGIEVAINLVKALRNEKVKLIITGTALDDHNKEYYCELVDLITKLELNDQVFFAAEHFANYRKTDSLTVTGQFQKKVFSLSDAYAYADACTYFSSYEGFGNAFVEAILAKKPIFVNNYKPVYWTDIGSKGFKTVMIEDLKLEGKNIKEIEEILYNKDKAIEIGNYNFKLGKKYFSFEVLENILQKLL